jgi:hypothetical protein
VAPQAGRHPQTRASPNAHTAAFHAAMTDLWAAVRTAKARFGRPAFFPLPAYAQVKAIPFPSADWHNRLYADFGLDVAAAHLLGRTARKKPSGAGSARRRAGGGSGAAGVRLEGGCMTRAWVHRRTRSFGIASLISWRGVWYVVHFGAVLRSAAVGEVDQPATGPGVPGSPGGC